MNRILVLLCLLANTLPATAQENVTVQFRVNTAPLKNAKNFGVRGSLSPLSWDKTYLLQDADKDGVFEGELTFPKNADAPLEYKYVYGDKNTVWELEGQNRFLLLDSTQVQLDDRWNVQNAFDLNRLPNISAEKLSEDFTVLKKALLAIHPGLYRYKTRSEMDSIFDHFQKVFAQPLSYREAFLQLTRLTSSIQCGHTFPSFYNQGVLVREVVLNQKDKLPFTFRILDGKMIVTASVAENANLPTGTEILTIDGVPAKTFLKETASLVKADGPNDAKRYADLNTFGVGDYFEAFDCYFPLLYPPVDQQYRLTVKTPGSQSAEAITVNTVTRSERTGALMQKYPDHLNKADQLWKLEFWENNTAYLQLGTFDVFQLSFEWSQFLKNAFAEIRKRKTRHLVIDIRWNEGGQDEVLLFIGKNIGKQPVKIPQRQDRVRYRRITPELRPYLYTWDSTFFDLSGRTQPLNDDYFLLTGENTTEIKPFDNAFGGQTYLLVNASNSSATFYFAEIARENKLATLIGETTGGSQKGLNASTLFFLRLPHSQLEIDIPIVGSFSDDKPAGGIPPDVPVSQSLEDLLKGEDSVLKAAKALIEQRN